MTIPPYPRRSPCHGYTGCLLRRVPPSATRPHRWDRVRTALDGGDRGSQCLTRFGGIAHSPGGLPLKGCRGFENPDSEVPLTLADHFLGQKQSVAAFQDFMQQSPCKCLAPVVRAYQNSRVQNDLHSIGL